MPRQRLMIVPSSAAVPAFGSPVAPACARGGGSGSGAEQPRLRLLQLVDVVVVVGEKRLRRLDVPRAGHLELEPNALLLALAPKLVYLGALCGLGRLRDLALERRDSLVALPERCLVVRAGLVGFVAGTVCHLRPLCRCLVALRLRLTRNLRLRGLALVLATHVRACLSSQAGKEEARTLMLGTGYGAVTKGRGRG